MSYTGDPELDMQLGLGQAQDTGNGLAQATGGSDWNQFLYNTANDARRAFFGAITSRNNQQTAPDGRTYSEGKPNAKNPADQKKQSENTTMLLLIGLGVVVALTRG